MLPSVLLRQTSSQSDHRLRSNVGRGTPLSRSTTGLVSILPQHRYTKPTASDYWSVDAPHPDTPRVDEREPLLYDAYERPVRRRIGY